FIKDVSGEKYSISYNWKEKTAYHLLVKDSSIKDIFGQYNHKVKTDFNTPSLKDYSSLNIHFLLKPSPVSYIVQLISTDETKKFIEFTIKGSEEKLFEYL